MSQYKIFTDGGCEPNPGQAGSGMAVYVDNDLTQLWFGCYQAMGTNNTAELNALYQAMLLAQKLIADNKTVSIFSDSKYSIQCLTQWASGWQKKGWKRSGGEIQNLDLIKPMFALYQQLETKLQLLHVNGHVGIEGNELADRMSILAIDKKQTLFSQYQQALDIKQILALRQG
ncbi:ribonuclease H family protein [Shewanella marina]|uniref:ribonuclease H family protein n=1 Tax=Shewanella marina TaxID=487319 RepID=UPI00277D10DB|nr:ribonuclease H [Shewanella marina]